MDLNYNADEEAFRSEVKDFLSKNVPADLSDKIANSRKLAREDLMRWQSILHKRGWGGPAWPKEFGGTGWSTVQRHIFDDECAEFDTPDQVGFGIKMVAPVIMAFGNEQQQDFHLTRILDGTHFWCQGYSEPGSGSDLASLKTKAERVKGDDGKEYYVVNGQKTWNTSGHLADWIFCLVRTSNEGKRQEGISFLLIDMKTPGISVRPIIMMDGGHEVNDIFLDNVKVPVSNRVGEENKGWTYAKYLLGHERTGTARIGRSKKELRRLKDVAARERSNGRRLIDDPRFRDRVAEVELELTALEITNLRVIASEKEKKGPGPEASILKLRGSEIQQTISELKMQALGPYMLPYQPEASDQSYQGALAGPDYGVPLSAKYFNNRKTTIYGGSNEIQRNIISQMILGL
jgi:alkylation response protein AidB-like acyl-CoA dehydrogenase